MKQDINQKIGASAGLVANPSLSQNIGFTNIYEFECLDKDGNVKWTDTTQNIVVTEGLNHVLDVSFFGATQFHAGATNWYCGIADEDVDTGKDPTNTLANVLPYSGGTSANGWKEISNDTDAPSRQSIIWDALGSGSSIINSTTKATFSGFTASFNVGGAFVCNAATGTSGVIYGVAPFSYGARLVAIEDTINVTITINLTSN